MNCWQLCAKVSMSCRSWNRPFKRGGVPWILIGDFLPPENTEQEIEQEDQLCRPENEGGIGDEHIDWLLRNEELVLQRIVYAPHLAADTKDVHRIKDAIHADEADPEMNLAQ